MVLRCSFLRTLKKRVQERERERERKSETNFLNLQPWIWMSSQIERQRNQSVGGWPERVSSPIWKQIACFEWLKTCMEEKAAPSHAGQEAVREEGGLSACPHPPARRSEVPSFDNNFFPILAYHLVRLIFKNPTKQKKNSNQHSGCGPWLNCF